MKVLIVTTEWPRFEGDLVGIHVVNQTNNLRRSSVIVDIFPFYGGKNILNYWRACLEFNRMDLGQYDVIHAHHGQSGLVALSQRKRPVVVTFHGSDLQGIRDFSGSITPLGYLLRFASQWVASQASAVILVSASLADKLPWGGLKYQLIPAGIDTEMFCPSPMAEARKALELPMENRLVLFVGDPARTEKRYWIAEQVVRSLSPELNVRLVVAHNIPQDRMPLFMNACDALLVTSSTEGSPNAVKEALACNLPVVATDVGDIRQRISSVQGCHVCETDNPAMLVNALEEVLYKPERINGRQFVLDLDEGILIQQVIGIYRKLGGSD
ncbi:MAG: glycosyltransferase family 4 protein [Chloroflexota bacterium]